MLWKKNRIRNELNECVPVFVNGSEWNDESEGKKYIQQEKKQWNDEANEEEEETKRQNSAQYLDRVQNVLNSSFVIYRLHAKNF